MGSRSLERLVSGQVASVSPHGQLDDRARASLPEKSGHRTLDPALGNQARLRSLGRSAPIQAKVEVGAEDRFEREAHTIAASIMARQPRGEAAAPAVQRREAAGARPEAPATSISQLAQAGVRGSGGSLPHFDTIQRAFGSHDISHVQAYTDAAASSACRSIGAQAYATGDKVAFAGAPSLFVAAHEAAHTVQQRSGVQLRGGVGEVGDAYERHADAVADAVTRGRSVQALLDAPGHAPGGPSASGDALVQRLAQTLSEEEWGPRFKELYAQARIANKWLGKFIAQVSKAIGGQGLSILHPPLKDKLVAADKCRRGGKMADPSTLLDIARATITFADLDMLFSAHEYIVGQPECEKMVDRLTENGRGAEKSGYKDIKYFMKAPNHDHFVELQLHLKQLRAASPVHHPWYEIVRRAHHGNKKDVVIKAEETVKLGKQLRSGWLKCQEMGVLNDNQLHDVKKVVDLFFSNGKPRGKDVVITTAQITMLNKYAPLVYQAFEDKANKAHVMQQDGLLPVIKGKGEAKGEAPPIRPPWSELALRARQGKDKDVVIKAADTGKIGFQLHGGMVKLEGMKALNSAQIKELRKIVDLFFPNGKATQEAVVITAEQIETLNEFDPLVYKAYDKKANKAQAMQ